VGEERTTVSFQLAGFQQTSRIVDRKEVSCQTENRLTAQYLACPRKALPQLLKAVFWTAARKGTHFTAWLPRQGFLA
jgi:hypothetical protein